MITSLLAVALRMIYEKQLREGNFPKEPPPPWETARINVPKNLRKGKTWEEIKEIKKHMWESMQ